MKFLSVLLFFISGSASASVLDSPVIEEHPGSQIYNNDYQRKQVDCNKRRGAEIFLPILRDDQTPTVVFGHGQALNVTHYEESFKHLAKKGIAVVFPDYSRNFFDQNWQRMGRDYVNQVNCALESEGLNKNLIVFSGHSKGAYVASVAAGLSHRDDMSVKPEGLVLLNIAGFDSTVVPFIPPAVETTLVFSDQDNVVDKELSETLYDLMPSLKKQFILLKSYPEDTNKTSFEAVHMWPLNKPFLLFGGGPIGPLHYYGLWKWLIAAAEDVKSGGEGSNDFIYGLDAVDKGPIDLKDDIIRSW